MDWNQIRAFLATAETGSLSAAARQLGLTQPTLSRQVAALEQNLGVLLFDRVGRSLRLTPSGGELLVHARAMASAANGLDLAACGQAQSVEGVVKIATSDVVATYLLPGMLEILHERAPGIRVDVVASNAISDLLRREADIAIRHVRPTQPDLIARRCKGTTAHLYAATRYLDAHGRPKTVRDLERASFIGVSGTDEFLAQLRLRGLPITETNFRCTSDSFVAVWEMVRHGLGIGVMFRPVADQTAGIEMVLPQLEPFPIPVWLVSHPEVHNSRRIRLVFDLLAELLS